MAIRTGKGDKGYTELPFRRSISKNSPEISAMGDLDELNAHLGFVKCRIRRKKEEAILEQVQHHIIKMISEISVGHTTKKKFGLLLTKHDTEWIKLVIRDLEQKVKLKNCFSLPGSGELSALLDVARAVARRAERSVVGLFENDKTRNAHILTYLNCVSDVLFILARERAKNFQKHTARKTRRKPQRKA